MQPTSQVTYFRGPTLPIIGQPTLALTYESATQPLLYSEAFVFVDGLHEVKHLSQRWCADSVNIAPVGNPEATMESAAKQWAKAATDNVLFEVQVGPNYAMPTWEWAPVDEKPLLAFWLRGKFTDEIKKARQTTKCTAFLKDLEACIPDLLGCFTQGSTDE